MKFKTDYQKVEKDITNRVGSYPHLEAQALLTSEEDFKNIFRAMPDIKTWIELGSGHGLGPLLFADLYPEKRSIGIEFEKSRFLASQELKQLHQITNVSFIHADLLDCDIPIGDAYFFYFPTGPVLDRVLFELSQRKDKFKIIAIESHGDFLPRLRKETWLKEIQSIPLSSARHFTSALIFENGGVKTSTIHDVSFLHQYLLIHDERGSWIGESFGMEWTGDDQFLLSVPPRSVKENEIKEVLTLDQIPPEILPALHLRALGELRILTSHGERIGYLRKIYVGPSFRVEISSGEQVEWKAVKQIFLENTLCYDSSLDYFFLPHVV